jgi:hypothetical protein
MKTPSPNAPISSLGLPALLLLFAALWRGSPAQAVALEQFAQARSLNGGEGSLRALTLDPQIYRSLRRADLGDLRIFNADGGEVPMLLRQPQEPPQTQLGQRPLTFYPLPETVDEAQPLGGLSLRIERSSAGEILELASEPSMAREEPSTPTAYLIDLGEGQARPQALRLQWQAGGETLLAPFRLAQSRDLSHWRTLKQEGVLSALRYAGNLLKRDRIELATSQRFLRLEWLNPQQRPAITAVLGEYRQTNPQSHPLHWLELGPPQKLELGGYGFDSGGPFPITRLQLQPPSPGMLYQGALWSRNSPDANWRKRQQFRQYWLEIDGQTWRSEALQLGRVRDRHWRITFTTPTTLSTAELPQLRAAYTPERLLFIAQGQAPFQVAYGSSIVPPPTNALAGLLRELDADGKTASPVTPGQPRKIGSGNPPPPPLPWEKSLLWTLLLAGVLLLAWMARRLMRDLNNPPEKRE